MKKEMNKDTGFLNSPEGQVIDYSDAIVCEAARFDKNPVYDFGLAAKSIRNPGLREQDSGKNGYTFGKPGHEVPSSNSRHIRQYTDASIHDRRADDKKLSAQGLEEYYTEEELG